jgi:hypothetical protein
LALARDLSARQLILAPHTIAFAKPLNLGAGKPEPYLPKGDPRPAGEADGGSNPQQHLCRGGQGCGRGPSQPYQSKRERPTATPAHAPHPPTQPGSLSV